MAKKLDILYEDKYLIVVNKPSNLLTISTKKEHVNTLYNKVLVYEKQKNKNNKIFIVHRLDKETSGLIVFAKDYKVKQILQSNWKDVKRYYIAIVEGILKDKKGVVKSYLKENKNLLSYSTKNEGKLAITKYEKVKSNNKYTLLNIQILTGRKNQIRVHMMDLGHKIIGDKKYCSSLDPLKRLGLHCNKLIFKHPISNELLVFETKIPKNFLDLFN